MTLNAPVLSNGGVFKWIFLMFIGKIGMVRDNSPTEQTVLAICLVG